MVMASAPIWTPDVVRSLPEDGKRYELIGGTLLVTPAPSWQHQWALADLFVLLQGYASKYRVGDVMFSPADLQLGHEALVQPDLFVVPPVGGRRPRDWSEVRELLLVVEAVSPSTASADRGLKRRFYQRARVPQYWIVDVDARRIERWGPGDLRPDVFFERIEWQPDAHHPPLVVDLAEFFSRVDPE